MEYAVTIGNNNDNDNVEGNYSRKNINDDTKYRTRGGRNDCADDLTYYWGLFRHDAAARTPSLSQPVRLVVVVAPHRQNATTVHNKVIISARAHDITAAAAAVKTCETTTGWCTSLSSLPGLTRWNRFGPFPVSFVTSSLDSE